MRASIDYHLRERQWTIGITSMFADALGVAPFKDNFWSKKIQPGNRYRKYSHCTKRSAAVPKIFSNVESTIGRVFKLRVIHNEDIIKFNVFCAFF